MAHSITSALSTIQLNCSKRADEYARLAWVAEHDSPMPLVLKLLDEMAFFLGSVEPEEFDERLWVNDLVYCNQLMLELGEATLDYSTMLDLADSDTVLSIDSYGETGQLIRPFRIESDNWCVKGRIIAEVPYSDLATLEQLGKIDYEVETSNRAYLNCHA